MTHECVKEIVKRNFKLFHISIRCMGIGFMDIVVCQSSIRVLGMLHCGIIAVDDVVFLLQGGRGRDNVV